MTFVTKELVKVGSVPIPNDHPNDQSLKAPAGSRLWVLTVSVRNDGETPAHEPFCHGRNKLGAELMSGHWWSHPWSKDSLLIDPNHQFCNDIPPGSTETFKLLFNVANGQGQVHRVLLQHRSSPADRFSYAFVTP